MIRNILRQGINYAGQVFNEMGTTDVLSDYKHASKIFIGGGSYRLIPKNAFLFHVFIDINSQLSSRYLTGRSSQVELGLMTKSSDLPKYTYTVKNYNAYNRPNLVQSKIGYDDVSMTFHDDSANVVRNFYYDYFRYYYRDSDYGDLNQSSTTASYHIPHKYQEDSVGNFGYTRRKEDPGNFIRAIRIYSLHLKSFSEYILINPLIKTFRHGTHVNSADPNTLECVMTVSYESVLYQDGVISNQSPDGFALLEYHDLTPSPLRNPPVNRSIFGSGGLLSTAGSALTALQQGNYLAAVMLASRGVNAARGVNLGKALTNEVAGIVSQGLITSMAGATSGPGSRRGLVVSTGSVQLPNGGLPKVAQSVDPNQADADDLALGQAMRTNAGLDNIDMQIGQGPQRGPAPGATVFYQPALGQTPGTRINPETGDEFVSPFDQLVQEPPGSEPAPVSKTSGVIDPRANIDRRALEREALEYQIIATGLRVTEEKNNLDSQIARRAQLESQLSDLRAATNPYPSGTPQHLNWERNQVFLINDVNIQLKPKPTAIELATTSHYRESQTLEKLRNQLSQLGD